MAEGERNRTAGGAIGRIVGSVVSPIVGGVDVDEIVERIDVNDVIDRVDLDAAIQRVDLDAALDRVDPDRLLDRVTPDRLLDRVEPDRLLDRVDPNRLLDRVDPNRLLDRVDADRLLDRVDPDRLLDRVDPDRLLDRVDPDRLLDRVDANRLLDRVDVNQLVARTELAEIVTRSTTGVFTSLLDVARSQIIIADQVVQGVPARILRRAVREMPPEPGHLDELPPPAPRDSSERAVAVQGRFAGAVSRFLAFLIDQFVVGAVFALGALLVQTAIRVLFQTDFDVEDGATGVVIAYVLWSFAYHAGSLAATGRTIGKAIMGLLVVRSDGRRVDGRHAAIRTVVFPLSFLLLGIGFLLGVVRRDRRQLHDLIADTGVVYAWDAETARYRVERERTPNRPTMR